MFAAEREDSESDDAGAVAVVLLDMVAKLRAEVHDMRLRMDQNTGVTSVVSIDWLRQTLLRVHHLRKRSQALVRDNHAGITLYHAVTRRVREYTLRLLLLRAKAASRPQEMPNYRVER